MVQTPAEVIDLSSDCELMEGENEEDILEYNYIENLLRRWIPSNDGAHSRQKPSWLSGPGPELCEYVSPPVSRAKDRKSVV